MSELTPSVFISYSWSSANHQDWVINLAERLMSDGVEVKLDKWDLKEGHDMIDFMETMVKSTDISKVLVILDKVYAQKADSRAGGVGTETQIISPNIYNDVSQEKFIPIVAELDDEDRAFIPTYLQGRMYIDLSNNEHFESNYEQLLRNIYRRPALRKPQKGSPPKYLFDESKKSIKTNQLLKQVKESSNRLSNSNGHMREFLDTFFINLKDFKVEFEGNEQNRAEKVYDNILSYTELRDEYITYFDVITKNQNNIDTTPVVNFFEKLPTLTFFSGSGSYYEMQFDNFKFFIHELFLYTITLGIKNENYDFVENMLYTSYFYNRKHDNNYDKPLSFDRNYHYLDWIDTYYNERFSKNLLSAQAELLIQRLPEDIDTDDFVQADLLLFFIAQKNNWFWFPMTYVYRKREKQPLFYKLISKKHFEKVKSLFGVKSVDEFKSYLKQIKENDSKRGYRYGYNNAMNKIVPIYNQINIDDVATTR